MGEQVAPIFHSLGVAMAAIAGRYKPSELTAIASFFRETTEALRSETAKLKHRTQSSAPA